MRIGIEKIFRGAIRRSLLDIVPPGRGILKMSEEILPEGVCRESHCATNESRILMFFAQEIARRAYAARFASNEMCHNAHVCTMATQTQILVPDIEAIRAAHRRISPRIHRTPVLTCASLDEIAGARLYFKCENLQKTGSF
jgi:hypothetical protein